jgi:hypothetical protein
VPGPAADIPVAGVRSASDIGVKEHRRAQYHLYRIDDAGGRDPAARVSLEVRGYDPAADRFIAEGEVRAL